MRQSSPLLLAAILLGAVASNAFAEAFSDVSGGPYAEASAYLKNKNIVHGYADGTVRPHTQLNRAEALKMVIAASPQLQERVSWYRSHMPPLPLFSDVDQRAWYAPYVEVAFENGIIKGYPDGFLRPERALSVEEAIVLLMRAQGFRTVSGPATLSPYVGNQDGRWFTPAINRAIEQNLVMHRSRLPLGAPISRGQFFDIVYRSLWVAEHSKDAFPEPHVAQTQPVQRMTPRPRPQPSTFNLQPSTSQAPARVIHQPQPAALDHPYGSEGYFSLTLPSLGITDLTVTHPLDPFSSQGVLEPLQQGVGHLFSYPGDGGKIMIYGHSSGYPWDVSKFTKIFRRVNELNSGDRIYVTYAGSVYEYEVTHEQAVSANDTSPFSEDGSGEELILYTCWPPDSIAERYLVHARPVGSVALRR